MQPTEVDGGVLSDSERLRQLVQSHIANGGTVKEACERFAFETQGAHSARASMLRWYLFLRYSKGGTEKRATMSAEALAAPSAQSYPELSVASGKIEITEEGAKMPQSSIYNVPSAMTEDETTVRLLQAVSAMVDDRRQMKELLQEYKKQIEVTQRQLRDSDDERKMLEFKLEKKDSEIDRQQRMMLDHQYKYEHLQEEFEQMQVNHQTEHNRLQEKVNELTGHYEELTVDYTRLRKESSKEIERLEMQLRGAELKNAQLSAKYEEIRKDNANLTRRVTDFAHQIAGFMDPTVFAQPQLAAVPIRTVLDNAKSEPEDRVKA
jgi:hypothetical protein